MFLFRLTATAHKSLRVGNDQLRVFSTTEKSPSGFLHDNHFPLLESSLVALTTWKVLWLTLFFLPFTQLLWRGWYFIPYFTWEIWKIDESHKYPRSNYHSFSCKRTIYLKKPPHLSGYTNPKQAYLFSLPAYLVFLFNKKRKQESWLAIFRVNNRFHSVYVCGQRCMYCGYYIMDVFTPICEPFPQLPSYTTTPLPSNKKEF